MTHKEKLQDHSEEFRKELILVTEGVHVAVGFSASNSIIIEGNEGLIIVDTTESTTAAKNILAVYRQLNNKPITAIIFTHSHRDHVSGATVFASEGGASEGELAIYSRAFTDDILGPKGIADVQRLRAKRQFGIGLPQEENLNLGLGASDRPLKGLGQGVLEATEIISEDGTTLTIEGVTLECHFAPGETDDTMVIYLPEKNLLIGADNYYKSFPNLYPIRGAPYRDVAVWGASLDKMMGFQAEYLIPGHSRPLQGKEKIHEVLSHYRTAILYVLDETLKGINKGKTPNELVDQISLPEHLAKKAYLQEFYGTVEWSIRSIFTGYLGWFDGNPSNLFQPTLAEEAQGLLELAGSQEALEQQLERHTENKNFPWALRLVDALIQLGVKGTNLKKAALLRGFAEEQINATARNYFFSYAKELESSA